MRKVLAVLLMAVCAVSLYAADTYSTKFAGQTVKVLMKDTPDAQQFRDVLQADFEKKTGIKVLLDVVPEAGMEAKLRISLAGGSGDYDVVTIDGKNYVQLAAPGWIMPLDKFLSNESVTPKSYVDGFAVDLRKLIGYQGKVYGIPFQIGTNMLYYNKEMFKAAGLDPNKGPTTWDELMSYAAKLNKPEIGQAGFVARATREGAANSFAWIMVWLGQGGSWTNVPGRQDYAVLDTPLAVKSAKFFTDLLTKYGPPGIAGYSWQESQLAMQQGKAAMWLDVAQLGPQLEDPSQSKIAGKVGYSIIRGDGDNWATVGGCAAYAIASNTKNEGAAWEMMRFLTGKDTQLNNFVTKADGSPTRKDVLSDPKAKATMNPDFMNAMAESMKHTMIEYSPLIPEGMELRNAVALALSKIMSGQATAEAAMIEANQSAIATLKKAGRYK